MTPPSSEAVVNLQPSPITTLCPSAIRAARRRARNEQWWADPAYQAIQVAFLEGKLCEYCGKPATVAHHNEDWMYATKETYYNPLNMTALCGMCHRMYRSGKKICPVCKEHYTTNTSDACSWCRGTVTKSKAGKTYHRARYYPRHPCVYRLKKNQGCAVRLICTYQRNRAELCERFKGREQ